MALVVAETPEQAREAAEALVVTYDEEPHDVVFAAGLPGVYAPESAPAAHKGDLEAELAASAVVVDAEYSTPEEHHSPMEPHAAIARWDGGRLEVIDSNQGSRFVADELAKLFSLDPQSARVRSEHVGGGFGSKGTRPHSSPPRWPRLFFSAPRTRCTDSLPDVLAGRLPQPLRPAGQARRRRGRPAAPFHHRAECLTSTVYEFVERCAEFGCDDDSDAHHSQTRRRTARRAGTPSWMPAPGEAPGSFALELLALDELAEKCGLDPIALRARNELALAWVSGPPFSGRNLLACFRRGPPIGWADRDPRPGVRRAGPLAARDRHGRVHVPRAVRPVHGGRDGLLGWSFTDGSPRPTSGPGPAPPSPAPPPRQTRWRWRRSASGCASRTATSASR